MEWFVEKHNGTGFMVKAEKIAERDGKQKIEIFSTPLGKMLVIDGKIQFMEADEFFYHEMLVHVPMMMHPSPERVLIIGGGDGGAAREALKHDVEHIKMVEIDRNVVEMCREYIGIDEGALDDRRVEIVYMDGMDFVKGCREKFDVIIVDGSDPEAMSIPLVSKTFYSECSRLCDLFVTQSQSPFLQEKYFRSVLENSSSFPHRRIYLSFMPSYPSGMWSFMIASPEKIKLDEGELEERWRERGIKTRYYNPAIHTASFALPCWVEKIAGEYNMD